MEKRHKFNKKQYRFNKNKSTPCTCCTASGCIKELWAEYYWMGEREVYGEMFADCFDISMPNGDHSICDNCIKRLRDASEFKKQVGNTIDNFTLVYPNVKNQQLNTQTIEEYQNIEYLESEGEEVVLIANEKLDDSDEGETDRYGSKRKSIKSINEVTKKKRRIIENVEPKNCGKEKQIKKFKREVVKLKKEEPKEEQTEEQKIISNSIRTLLNCTNVMPFKTLPGKYVCVFCRLPYENPLELRSHSRKVHNVDRFIHIDKVMPDKNIDFVKLDVNNLQCTICYKKIKDWDDLFPHLSEAHDVDIDQSHCNKIIPYILFEHNFKCVKCNVVFANFQHLNLHMNLHYRNYICHTCGDTFLTTTRLIKHTKIKHRVEEYACTECVKTFLTQRCLDKHMNAHSHENKIRCQYCPERFPDFYARYLHMSVHHKTMLKKYPCEICGAVFDWRPFLNDHQRNNHHDEKKHPCYHCTRTFYDEASLERHVCKGSSVFKNKLGVL